VDKTDIRAALQQLERTRQKQSDQCDERSSRLETSPLYQGIAFPGCRRFESIFRIDRMATFWWNS
jgi:hypothetical protein